MNQTYHTLQTVMINLEKAHMLAVVHNASSELLDSIQNATDATRHLFDLIRNDQILAPGASSNTSHPC
jgi:hypothetical protein